MLPVLVICGLILSLFYSCVNLTQVVAEKIKNYCCPNCSKRRGQRYKFGQIPNFDHTPDIKPSTPMKSHRLGSTSSSHHNSSTHHPSGRPKRGRSPSRSRSPSPSTSRGGAAAAAAASVTGLMMSPRQPRSTRSTHSHREIERAQSRSPSPSPARSASGPQNEGLFLSFPSVLCRVVIM
jgi:hypothetical protein